MDKNKYIQAIARVRVLETRLLDDAKINRMIESSTADEAIKVLAESEYAHHIGNIERAEEYERVLSEELKRVYDVAHELTPDKEVVDIMTLRYDYHNLKTLVKARALGKDLDYLLIPVGSINTSILKEAIETESGRDLSPIMREGLEGLLANEKAMNDPQQIDIVLDVCMYNEMSKMAEKVKDEYITKYVQTNIDFYNLLTFFRCKKQSKSKEFMMNTVVGGGKIDLDRFETYYNDSVENFVSKIAHLDYDKVVREGVDEFQQQNKLVKLEKLRDNYLVNFIKEAKYVSFGPEPILAYVAAKENEIKTVRTVMVGKLNNVSEEDIKGRLRDNYA